MTNREEFKDKIAKTIWETSRADEGTISVLGAQIVADAVLSVVDEEVERLRKYVTRAHGDEAWADLMARHDALRVEVARLQKEISELKG